MAQTAILTVALGADHEATIASQGVDRTNALALARVLGQLQSQLLDYAASPAEEPAQETTAPASQVQAGAEVPSS